MIPQFAESAITSALMGTAVAEAIVLPYEGLSHRRVVRLRRCRTLEHRFQAGFGFCLDDTENTCMDAPSMGLTVP